MRQDPEYLILNPLGLFTERGSLPSDQTGNEPCHTDT